MAASTLHLLLILSALVMTASVVRGDDDEPKEVLDKQAESTEDEPKEVSDEQDDAEIFDAELFDEDEGEADDMEMDGQVKNDAWWTRRRRTYRFHYRGYYPQG